jgi:hyperosmotically inducible periplasmic protein
MSVRTDEQLREQIDELVADTLVVDPVDLAVVVTEGVVRLEGTVDDEAGRAGLEERIRGLEGVRGIENRLRVRPQPAT